MIKNVLNKAKSLLTNILTVWPYLYSHDSRYQECTEEYPDVISSRMDQDLSPKTRGFLKNDLSVCTGCNECIQLCPAKALEMQSEILMDGSIKVNRFNIDLGKCVFCSLCVEICPVKSIGHTRTYEMEAYSRTDLVLLFNNMESAPQDRSKLVKDKIRMIRSYEVRK